MFRTRHSWLVAAADMTGDDDRPAGRLVWTNELAGRDRRTIRPHTHAVHEVLWAATGTRTVEIGDDTWIIPPTIGVVIPAGTPHGGHVAGATGYRCTMIDPALAGTQFTEAVAIAITPAWREVVLRLRGVATTWTPAAGVESSMRRSTSPNRSTLRRWHCPSRTTSACAASPTT